jgi:hypothetical protein
MSSVVTCIFRNSGRLCSPFSKSTWTLKASRLFGSIQVADSLPQAAGRLILHATTNGISWSEISLAPRWFFDRAAAEMLLHIDKKKLRLSRWCRTLYSSMHAIAADYNYQVLKLATTRDEQEDWEITFVGELLALQPELCMSMLDHCSTRTW